MRSGYVYLLLNASMPGLVKIGRTERNPDGRAAELSKGTGVPTPFVLAYQVRVSDCELAEHRVHQVLAAHRTNAKREFFKITATDAVHIIQAACADLRASDDEHATKVNAAQATLRTSTRSNVGRTRSRTAERLGPVVAQLGLLIRRASSWRELVDHFDRTVPRVRHLSYELQWNDASKAARAASTVSIASHDRILELEEPLRELRGTCWDLWDNIVRASNQNDRISEVQFEFGLEDLRVLLEDVMPKLQRTYDELTMYVPELLP
jgi:hypothetical protein